MPKEVFMENNFLFELKEEQTVFGSSECQEQKTWTGLELFNLDQSSIPTLVGDIIPKQGMFTIVGASDTGKSMFLRQLAICVATNEPFVGFQISATHKKVIFISTEDDHISTSFLLQKQGSRSPEPLENIRFYFETDEIPEYLEAELESNPADLVIIDAWSDVFGQNLNDSALIRQTLKTYRSIANKFNCAIGFLHHTGKRTENIAPNKNNILSGQGFEAKMRLVIELRNDQDNQDFKHLCIVKGNYLSKEYKEKSFKLHFDTVNMKFDFTGERVPFDELVGRTDKPEKKALLKASEVDKSTHQGILEEVFKNGLKLRRKELETRLSNVYSKHFSTQFGGRRVEAYLDYLIIDLALIGKEGKDRSPQSYYFLTTHYPTSHMRKIGD